MRRDEGYWKGLMTLGLDCITGPARFVELCGGRNVLACSPYGWDNKPVRVSFNLNLDGDHYLFKSERDTRGRSHAMERRPEDFQQSRADRLGWIPEVLRRPDAVYADKQQLGTFLYVCRTLASEEFAVVIQEVRTPRTHYLVTGYVLTEPEWGIKKRTRLRKSFPHNSKALKKKKGTR